MPDRTVIEKLERLLGEATAGPFRAHDHNDMAQFGSDPANWMGYAWVGRVTKDSTPDRRWDAGHADMDRRKDASKEYRERASVDAHLVAAALNSLPALLQCARALEPFAKDAEEWSDDVPGDYRSLCTEPGSDTAHPGSETAFTVGDLRRARQALAALEGVGR